MAYSLYFLYLMAMASWNSHLVRLNPWEARGIAPSQLEATGSDRCSKFRDCFALCLWDFFSCWKFIRLSENLSGQWKITFYWHTWYELSAFTATFLDPNPSSFIGSERISRLRAVISELKRDGMKRLSIAWDQCSGHLLWAVLKHRDLLQSMSIFLHPYIPEWA